MRVGSTGKMAWIPLKQYPCAKIADVLQIMLSRKDFFAKLGNRFSRNGPAGLRPEVWDADVWSRPELRGYLSDSNNLALTINCDWFNPFVEIQYSAGQRCPSNLKYSNTDMLRSNLRVDSKFAYP